MKRILEAYDRSVFEITSSFIIVTFPYASGFEQSEEEISIETSGKENVTDFGTNGTVNGTIIENEVLNEVINTPDEVLNEALNGADGTVNGVSGTVNDVNGIVNGTVSENDVLNALKVSPQATYDELARLLNMPRRTVARHIKILREKGAIKRIGSDKTGYWEII